MKSIEKTLKNSLILSICLSVGFVAGIPAIVLGAVNEITAVMVIGIILTVIGFYGTPMAWINYGANRSLKRLINAIKEEHLYSVQELAVHLSQSEKVIRTNLNKCFLKGYLTGYKKDGDNIILNEGVDLNKKEYSASCPFCGAKFTYTIDNPRCPYCNSPVISDKENGN